MSLSSLDGTSSITSPLHCRVPSVLFVSFLFIIFRNDLLFGTYVPFSANVPHSDIVIIMVHPEGSKKPCTCLAFI